jgi:hypothetical protein
MPTPIDYGAEKKPLRDRLFDWLSDLRWHTYKELRTIGGTRYGARILELKRLGYRIETRNIEGSTGKEYRLTSLVRGEPQPKRVKAFLPAADVAMFLSEGIVSPAIKGAIEEAFKSYEVNKTAL